MTDEEEQIVNDAFRMIGTAISRIDEPGDIDAALDEICDAVNRIEPDLLVAATRGRRRWPPAVVDASEGSDPGGRGAPWTPAGDSTRWGNAAFSCLPQIRSAASQSTISARRTASS